MSSNLSGTVRYRSVIGSSLKDRMAFDGSVPYSISCATDMSFVNSTGTTVPANALFCVVGNPGNYSAVGDAFPAETRTGLAKRCLINLRDIWIRVADGARLEISIFTYDPTDAVPEPTAQNNFLYEGSCDGTLIKIPDISGLVLSAGLSIGVQVSGYVGANAAFVASFHSVADIDD